MRRNGRAVARRPRPPKMKVAVRPLETAHRALEPGASRALVARADVVGVVAPATTARNALPPDARRQETDGRVGAKFEASCTHT
jgi:hypothetical protein